MITNTEVTALFNDPIWAAQFPPLLSVDQVARLLQVPKNTVYSLSSRGVLDFCKTRVGKNVRFFRDQLIQRLSQGEL